MEPTRLAPQKIALTASDHAVPADPAGTTSTSFVMAGLGRSFQPTSSAKVLVLVSGSIGNSTGADGATCQVAYGTGTAPANGAAAVGTVIGNVAQDTVPSANTYDGFTCVAIVQLVAGTTYWFDLQFAALNGGEALLKSLSFNLFELVA